jgi:hypothetical protein
MRELGKHFGASSHEIGRWLVEIGLRTESKEPSQMAIAGGYCKRQSFDGPGLLVVWHVAKTIAALEAAGHKQIVKPPTMPVPTSTGLTGPFTLEQSGINGYLIRGGDGATALWLYGEEATQKVLHLLNVADKHRYFG